MDILRFLTIYLTKKILISCSAKVLKMLTRGEFDHIFYSGALDRFFDFSEGDLGYRTLDFEVSVEKGVGQGLCGYELLRFRCPIH